MPPAPPSDSDRGPALYPGDPPPGGRIELLGEPGALTVVLSPAGDRKVAFHAVLSTVVFGGFALMAWVGLVLTLLDPHPARGQLLTLGFLSVGFSLGTWGMATAALASGPGRFEIKQDGEELILRTTWRGRAIAWWRYDRSQVSLLERETGAPVATLALKMPHHEVNLDRGLEQAEVEWLQRMLAAMLAGAP